jgi:DNA excision repair protein ERCC-3
MTAARDLPIIIQQDKSILLDVHHPLYEEARNSIARFSELEKAPEHVHTYRITPISLWNAAAQGASAADVKIDLGRFSRHGLPRTLLDDIDTYISRYGKIRLERSPRPDRLFLRFLDPWLEKEVASLKSLAPWFKTLDEPGLYSVPTALRGEIKWELIKLGYPIEDHAGFAEGAPLAIRLRERSLQGAPFALRDYQREAVEIFHQTGSDRGGHGVIVLPCGAGKTMVGLGIMERTASHTLILSTGTVAVRQWIREILDKTSLEPSQVGEYSGERKQIRPVTVSTYQILTHRESSVEPFKHLDELARQRWGLVIYDEVHLLPAPVFRFTAGIQSVRRLGLTATLLREDGREADVFGLVGPKKYDVPWRTLERREYIAEARCFEIRSALDASIRERYHLAPKRAKFRIASENPAKLPVLRSILDEHAQDHILIIGQYVEQLRAIAREIDAPLIDGSTPSVKRERLFADFRAGRRRVLVVSRVANFAIDLPQASVGIQVSGAFGSRQEEAQRLGRLLRPKEGGSVFYTLVSRDTVEQDFALLRQRFLAEQGYRYVIEDRDP